MWSACSKINSGPHNHTLSQKGDLKAKGLGHTNIVRPGLRCCGPSDLHTLHVLTYPMAFLLLLAACFKLI